MRDGPALHVSFWSAKGGSGTTVAAASLALVLARDPSPGVLLVDLGGDVPAVLGVPEPAGPGLTEWLGAGDDVPVDALARLEVAAVSGLSLLPRGAGVLGTGSADGAREAAGEITRADVLAGVLAAEARHVVIDCGVVVGDATPAAEVARVLAATAVESVLVTRLCYLGLRRAVGAPLHPSGIVVLAEQGRPLRAADAEAVLHAPVLAEVPYDPAIARAVDAGLLAARLPAALVRAFRYAA